MYISIYLSINIYIYMQILSYKLIISEINPIDVGEHPRQPFFPRMRHVTLAHTKWGVVPVYPSMQFSIHFSWARNHFLSANPYWLVV